ncbi:MAG: hypothetical protein SF097_23475 [Acidobacteriota bacterium]|nr:hypothetical protein [Acidobacteriota bacterium]
MTEAAMRMTLWASVLLNGVGAMLFAFPSSGIGAALGLPDPTPYLYNTLCALFVGLFGGAYVWLVRQPQLDRPLVAFAAITKASVFTVFLIFWLKGVVTTLGLLMVFPHLVVACLFARWLLFNGQRQ